MERYLRLTLCALLMAPLASLAQEEPAVEMVPAEEAPAEAAPEESPAEAAPAAEAPAEEAAAAEGEGDASGGWSFGPAAGSYVDVLYLPTTLLTAKAGGVSGREHGDGFGGRGLYRVGKHLGASGEYQWRKYDEADIDISDLRLGLGLLGDSSSGGWGGLFLEYDKSSSDQIGDTDGYSLHARLTNKPNEWFSVYGDLGYFRLDSDSEKLTGSEFTAGVSVLISGNSGLFADCRRTALEGKDSGVRLSIADVRVGARLSFGSSGE